jgi:hypothetical protein
VRSTTTDAQRRIAARGNAIDTNKYVSITTLTRVKMLLSIAHQHQAATAKSFVARPKTNDDDRPAGAHAKTVKYKSTSIYSGKLQVAKGHESLV